jgi:hypothetical protein
VPALESGSAADAQSGPVGKPSGRATSTLPSNKAPVPSYLDEIAAAIPADLADLRPEDLRVEAEFFHNLARAPESEPTSEAESFPAAAPEPPAAFRSVDLAPSVNPIAVTADAPKPAGQTHSLESPHTVPWLETPAAAIKPSPDVPPIEIEPASILPPDREFRPVQEVVLPASVVLVWSVFALVGIATSFIAGLMLGHYFWKM